METTLALISPESWRRKVAVTVNVFTDLKLMRLRQQQMAGGTWRLLDCAARCSRGWWRVRATFHICCLHEANMTLPLSCRPSEKPNEVLKVCLLLCYRYFSFLKFEVGSYIHMRSDILFVLRFSSNALQILAKELLLYHLTTGFLTFPTSSCSPSSSLSSFLLELTFSTP